LNALRRGLDAGKVTKEDFEEALTQTRASVTEQMLGEYEQIQQTLKSDAVRPGGIGFVLPGMLRSRGGKGGGEENQPS
jgi:transitional endoplasmic reticulum ATPase